jgi:pimeloyl-ACP methyl ester carboxylesterase
MSAMTATTPLTSLPEPAQRSRVQRGDVGLSVCEWGKRDNPTVVLVHGFPDCSRVWAGVVPLLMHDFHVVTYDVRGAGLSDKPKPISAYRLPELRADFEAVIQAVSPHKPVHIMAHDWGSVQTWESVTEPSLKGRIASFTSCSGPSLDHTGHLLRNLLGSFTLKGWGAVALQMLKSWYVYYFHLPFLPRWQMRFVMPRLWPVFMRHMEGLDVPYDPHFGSNGSYGIQLYRANIFPRTFAPRMRYAIAPVQVLVPTKDLYVGPMLTSQLSRWVPHLTRTEYPAKHWMPLSHPQAMADALRQFIVRINAETEAL